MKKGSKSKTKNKTLKKLKEENEKLLKDKKFEDSLILSKLIIKKYPKNSYGYVSVIKSMTNNFEKYLSDAEVKYLKGTYEIAYDQSTKKDKSILQNEFNEYLDDIHEVENLKKVKREIVGKELLENIYDDEILFINQSITTLSNYNVNGKKIKNVYDFIKGLFLLSCLIINLIKPNYLLTLTIPFGIFGLIIIYSFVDDNFIKKGKLKNEKKNLEEMLKMAKNKVLGLKEEIKLIEDNKKFLYEQKKSVILKIPNAFSNEISSLISNDEKLISNKMINALSDNNLTLFFLLIDKETNLNATELVEKINNSVKAENEGITNYINIKLNEKKQNQHKIIYMKKIKNYNYVLMLLFLLISIFSFVIVINNFNKINFLSFVIALLSGIMSMLIYNINSGKHSSLFDAFTDNIVACVFNASLAYNLVYSIVFGGIKFTYAFIKIPILFLFLLSGFVMLVSYFKYKNLLNKLTR